MDTNLDEEKLDKETLKKFYDSFKNQPFLSFVDMKLDKLEKGKSILSCENKKELHQGLGYMHGGVVASILDTAGGYAAVTTIPSNCFVVTSELKINYMRPVIAKKVFGFGEVINKGRNLVVVEATLKDEKNNMLAKMLATMFVIENQTENKK